MPKTLISSSDGQLLSLKDNHIQGVGEFPIGAIPGLGGLDVMLRGVNAADKATQTTDSKGNKQPGMVEKVGTSVGTAFGKSFGSTLGLVALIGVGYLIYLNEMRRRYP